MLGDASCLPEAQAHRERPKELRGQADAVEGEIMAYLRHLIDNRAVVSNEQGSSSEQRAIDPSSHSSSKG